MIIRLIITSKNLILNKKYSLGSLAYSYQKLLDTLLFREQGNRNSQLLLFLFQSPTSCCGPIEAALPL